eukprot:SAG22_NODE_1489_length_4310_cov_7.945856_2_plen_258_part_00
MVVVVVRAFRPPVQSEMKEEFRGFMEDFNTATMPHPKYYGMEKYEREVAQKNAKKQQKLMHKQMKKAAREGAQKSRPVRTWDILTLCAPSQNVTRFAPWTFHTGNTHFDEQLLSKKRKERFEQERLGNHRAGEATVMLLKAVITAFPSVSLPFFAVPLRLHRTVAIRAERDGGGCPGARGGVDGQDPRPSQQEHDGRRRWLMRPSIVMPQMVRLWPNATEMCACKGAAFTLSTIVVVTSTCKTFANTSCRTARTPLP